MCISSAPAEFTGTTVMVNRTDHPVHGLIDVVGYQNTAQNRATGPNAMLLHFPAKYGMTQDNFLDTSRAKNILKDMVDAVRPRTRGMSKGLFSMGGLGVQVFEHGIYTVVLSQTPELIASALEQVPAHKRPQISPDLLAFYAEHFPEWSIALCCFDNRQAREAEPLLVYYTPMETQTLLRLPALDCHTGGVPELHGFVDVDHWLIYSHEGMEDGLPVFYQDDIPDELASFLPKRVRGQYVAGLMPNGDFMIDPSSQPLFHVQFHRVPPSV